MSFFSALFAPFTWLWQHSLGSSDESRLKRTERESKRKRRDYKHQRSDTKHAVKDEKKELKLEKHLYKEERKATKAVKRLKRAIGHALEIIAEMRHHNTPELQEGILKVIGDMRLLSQHLLTFITDIEADIGEEEQDEVSTEHEVQRSARDAKVGEDLSEKEAGDDPTIGSIEKSEADAERGIFHEARDIMKTEEWKRKMQEVEHEVFLRHETRLRTYDERLHALNSIFKETNILHEYDMILDRLMDDLKRARHSVAKEMTRSVAERKNLKRMGKLVRSLGKTEKKVGHEVREQEEAA